MQETPLRQIIDETGRIRPEDAFDIAGRAAREIEAIHDSGRVHGSIGAGTVFLGPHDIVTIDESGLSAEVRTTTTHEMDAATIDVVAYFSPEQARGLEIDQRSDLYSLGVLLFEMLTGSLPFEASSPTAVAYEHATVPPPRLDEIHPDIPSHLADIVDKALAKDPADRYQSAAEMSSTLAEAREELGLATTPVSLASAAADEPTAAATPAGPYWSRVAMASLVLLLGAVSAAGILPMLPASERSSMDASAAGAESGVQGDTREGPLAGDRATRTSPRSGEPGPGGALTPPPTRAINPSPTTTTAPTTSTSEASIVTTTQPTTTTTDSTTTTVPTTTTTAPTTSTSEASIVTTTQPTTTTTDSTTTTVPTTSTSESQP